MYTFLFLYTKDYRVPYQNLAVALINYYPTTKICDGGLINCE